MRMIIEVEIDEEEYDRTNLGPDSTADELQDFFDGVSDGRIDAEVLHIRTVDMGDD